ncbi:MAG TPA: hypothetical protein PLW86_17015, partial [Rhodocyclaceae bacterium]|nr:hypothetical protein [Rhodocyclaceae bacterium]
QTITESFRFIAAEPDAALQAKLEALIVGDNRRHIHIAMDDLGAETDEFAHRRMDQSVKRALAGKRLNELPVGEEK